MRDIHWKLSAKTDSLIVREPIEPVRGQAVLSFDLAGTRDAVDRTLGLLQWCPTGFCHRSLRTRSAGWTRRASSRSRRRLRRQRICVRFWNSSCTRVSGTEHRPLPIEAFQAADWRYHIGQTQAEVAV